MENLGGWDHSEDHPDFDPNLLNVESWGVDHHQDEVHVNVNVNNVTDQHDAGDGRNSRLHSRKKHNSSTGSWGDSHRHVDQWSSLGVTEFDHPEDNAGSMSKHDSDNNMHLQQSSGLVGIPNETVEAAMEAAVAAISETSDSSGDRSGGSSENNSYINISQHLHPLGIQSSASCPTPAHGCGPTFQEHQQVQQQAQQHNQQQLQQHQQQQQHTIQGACSVGLSQPMESSMLGLSGMSTAAPAATSTITNTSGSTQHLSSLAANFMLAQAANSTVAATAAAAAAATAPSPVITTGASAQDRQQQHTASVISQPSTVPSRSISKNANSKTGGAASSKHSNKGTRQPKAATKKKKKKSKTSANAGASSSGLPPFYLFDAPIELRANFMQNQRRLGLPIQHDPNSYHYGETVNGFHPHQYQLPFGANASDAAVGSAGAGVPSPVRPANAPPPQLIDARHGNHRRNKGGHVKNEREQKRAQKITELIEQLRLQMETGGWQVEARSKFHTLSNCAQYIKHMIKLSSDKENENQKLNVELDEKRRKLERENEDKAMQEGRSDPESVTSSLTSDTASHKQEDETIGEIGVDNTKMRKLPNITNQEGGSSGDDSNNIDDANHKKHRIISSEAMTEDSSGDDNRDGSGTGSGSGNSRTESGSGGSGSGEISKTISSVSELTDSNRGSSSNNSGSGGGSSVYVHTEQDSRESTTNNMEDGADEPSTSSISSDAAVTSEKTGRDRNTGHKDVVFNNDKRMGRKRPPEEVTSLERTFELNYEEVFHKSNIPQLIASTSGKIVTWNECFVKATGYRKSEIEQMTIFSLVKAENLAKFFEIVAAALRPDDEEITNEQKDVGENGDSSINIADTNSFREDKVLKQNTISESTSSQDSLSGHDTVICRNNEMDCEQWESKNLDVKKDESTDDDTVAVKRQEEPPAKSEEGNKLDNFVARNSIKEETSSNVTEDKGTNKINSETSNEEPIDNSNEGVANQTKNLSEESKNNKGKPEEDANDINLTKKGREETLSQRLLNYTAMTLPCIDFPAMIKRNQAATESNSVIIPALHVTVTLMSDKDPRRRCFHCVFTNSKGTNGSLGIITPELLASLFATPLRSSRRKKKPFSSHGAGAHQHQRKRARGGTTRVGQSVSTSTTKNDEQDYCMQHIVSTNEEREKSPSPLLMPPPGPPIEDYSKQEEREPKKIKTEISL